MITKDEQGKRYGMLTVIKRYPENNRKGIARWVCKCDCGNETIVRGDNLRKGNVKGCGCSRIENVKLSITTHSQTKTKLYRIWASMKNRCNNKNSQKYYLYGGRGITICEKWNTFEGFHEDMREGYRDRLTLDRKDNNGNYEKSNCRWATQIEQCNNVRRNIIIMFNGKADTLANMCRKYDKNYSTIVSRINHYGWTVERALTT